jgi:hypothetical protein
MMAVSETTKRETPFRTASFSMIQASFLFRRLRPSYGGSLAAACWPHN